MRKRRRRNEKEAWKMVAIIGCIFFVIVLSVVATQEAEEYDSIWLREFQEKIELLKENSPEIRNEYVPIEKNIQKLERGEFDRQTLQNMFDVLSNQIAPHFAAKSLTQGTYGEKNSNCHIMVTSMMNTLLVRIRDFEQQ